MIDAKELRIGNAIWDVKQQRVKWVTHRVISDIASHPNEVEYEGIPLSPEILEKCGFVEIITNHEWEVPDHSFSVKRKYSTNHFEWLHTDLKYLHQLMNLYYCLTGEELEVKL